ncbi:uncharacterized protein LOC115299173 isoform X2 [Suricata suricatta]|uniref:uncharacterized protein LOC115299173 isoform X2 n=1 Tax=Suricata suricatta TaxID=37032 RepID=UPI001155BEF6|nr:uncharacterized protein LOC115299173 isoform X2 [Suricata suricatta]
MCYGHRAGCWGYKQTEMRCRPCPQEIHPLVEERVKQVIVTMHAEKVKSRKRGLTRSQIFLYLVLEHVASVTGRKVHFQGTLRPDVSRGPAERNPSLRGGCTSGQEATQQSSKQPWTHRAHASNEIGDVETFCVSSGSVPIRGRRGLPPMICSWAGGSGLGETEASLAHRSFSIWKLGSSIERPDTHTEERCMRRGPSASQGARSQKKPNLLTPRS